MEVTTSMNDRGLCGYEALFVTEVPNCVRCVVCHLVLRQAVQLMTCSHRFCAGCLQVLKKCSHNMKTELCCPIDRVSIDMSKVFNDTRIDDVVGNLKVRCSNIEHGCSWKGSLSLLRKHESGCEHIKTVVTAACESTERKKDAEESDLYRKLSQRLDQQEAAIKERDRKEWDNLKLLQELSHRLGLQEKATKESQESGITSLEHYSQLLKSVTLRMEKQDQHANGRDKVVAGLNQGLQFLQTRFDKKLENMCEQLEAKFSERMQNEDLLFSDNLDQVYSQLSLKIDALQRVLENLKSRVQMCEQNGYRAVIRMASTETEVKEALDISWMHEDAIQALISDVSKLTIESEIWKMEVPVKRLQDLEKRVVKETIDAMVDNVVDVMKDKLIVEEMAEGLVGKVIHNEKLEDEIEEEKKKEEREKQNVLEAIEEEEGSCSDQRDEKELIQNVLFNVGPMTL